MWPGGLGFGGSSLGTSGVFSGSDDSLFVLSGKNQDEDFFEKNTCGK